MFLLDANVFIEAYRTYYAFDFAPKYWVWLEQEHEKGNVASIMAIRKELAPTNETDDDLGVWALGLPQDFWKQPVQSDFRFVADLINWADTASVAFRPEALAEFNSSADLVLAAQAAGGGYTVVTREQSNPLARRRVMLPDAAAEVKVTCVSPFQMYRSLGLRL